MTAGAVARAALGEVLDAGVSPLLAAAGFGPRTTALTYRRRLPGEVTHVLRWYAQTRGEAEGAYVRSSCLVSHDAVRALAHELWTEPPGFADGPFPDELNLMPDFWEHGSQKRQWYPATAHLLADQLRRSVELDLLPLLEDVRDPGALAPAWDAGRMLPTYENGELYVAVAEAAAGRTEEAVRRLRGYAEKRPASLRPRLRLDDVVARLEQRARTGG